MNDLDFIIRLNEHVNTLGLFVDCNLSILQEGESMALIALPGGTETLFMDGTRDKDYNVQFTVKSKSQANCIGALNAIAEELESLKTLTSSNNSFEFYGFTTTGMPSYVSKDDQGHWMWQLTLVAEITIIKE